MFYKNKSRVASVKMVLESPIHVTTFVCASFTLNLHKNDCILSLSVAVVPQHLHVEMRIILLSLLSFSKMFLAYS